MQERSAASGVWSQCDAWAILTGNEDKAAAIKAIILDEEFWVAIGLFCRLVKPIVQLRHFVASEAPTMGKVSVH